jgi:hypothetical protein
MVYVGNRLDDTFGVNCLEFVLGEIFVVDIGRRAEVMKNFVMRIPPHRK